MMYIVYTAYIVRFHGVPVLIRARCGFSLSVCGCVLVRYCSLPLRLWRCAVSLSLPRCRYQYADDGGGYDGPRCARSASVGAGALLRCPGLAVLAHNGAVCGVLRRYVSGVSVPVPVWHGLPRICYGFARLLLCLWSAWRVPLRLRLWRRWWRSAPRVAPVVSWHGCGGLPRSAARRGARLRLAVMVCAGAAAPCSAARC